VSSYSAQLYSYHTVSVGEGPDEFFALNENIDPNGILVEKAREYLEKDKRENNVHSLLVLPEGAMLNYLTHIPNAIPYYFFAPMILTTRGEDIMHGLHAAPPDRVLVLSRDMREFGVGRFGESRANGKDLIEFLDRNYQAVYSFGGDPLDPNEIGFVVYALKSIQ
jgi:hypothetical protein